MLMKKRLTFLFALLSLLVTGANAQKTETLDGTTLPAADKEPYALNSVTVGPNGELVNSQSKGYIKVRTGNSGSTLTLNVNEGFIVTGISVEAYSNNTSEEADRSITLTGISVDGGESVLAENVVFPGGTAGQTPATASASGFEAKESIVLSFDNSNIDGNDSKGKNKQIMAKITVTYEEDAAPAGDAVTFDFTGVEAPYGVPASSGAAGGNDLEAVNEGVTLKFERGSAFYLPYFNANSLYIRSGNTGYFLAPEGKTITKVEINVKSTPAAISLEGSTNTDNTITWEGDATGVKFKVSANVSITTAVVTLADATANSDNSVVESLSAPEATVEITEIAESIQSGDDLNVKVKITNTGKGVIERLSVDAYTDIWNDTWGNSKTITNLAAGASEEVTILLDEVETNKESFQLKIQAVVYGKGITFESEEKTVKVVAPAPELTVAISEAPESVIANQNFTVKGRVTNIGSVDAADIHVVAVVNNVEWSGSTSTIASLEADGEYSDVTVNVNEIDVDGESFTLKLRALVKFGDSTVQFESAEKTIAYDATSTEGIDLAVTKIAAPESVQLSDDVTDFKVVLTVTNNGTKDAENVDVVLYANDKKAANSASNVNYENLTIKAGESKEVTLWVGSLGSESELTLTAQAVVADNESETEGWYDEDVNGVVKVAILLEEENDFEVAAIEAPETVTESTFDVIVTINAPEAVEEATVKVWFDTAIAEKTVALKAGENTVTVTVDVEALNLAKKTYEVGAQLLVDGEEYWNDEDVNVTISYTTGIIAVKTAIAEGAAVYSINGQRLNAPAKGSIVIINGKKVAVK